MTQAIEAEHIAARLYVAFELGASQWKLAVSVGGSQVREVTLEAGALDGLERELVAARERFALAPDAPVVSCYEAGRDGFWLHRWLTGRGVANLVVDSSSIEVNRRARRAKTDRLDARKLLGMLVRHHRGEKVWSVVRVPTVADEDRRRPHRELDRLKGERTAHGNRILGLLCLHGIRVTPGKHFRADLAAVRLYDGSPVPAGLQAELLREYERLEQVRQQCRELEAQRQERLEEQPCGGKVSALLRVKGIGINGAWVLAHELFGWREFRNRKELAGYVGLTPAPYHSGDSHHDQGISKAGNPRVRKLLIELAWGWLRWQPGSALSQWFQAKFAAGSGRTRRIGIVALARRLLVALWRYADHGVVPEGALLKA